ncbi:MAG: sulfurtransferase TusA family protein [Gammaproteobacteria bacterium]
MPKATLAIAPETMTKNTNTANTESTNTAYYRRHVFVCENKRADGACCADHKPALKLLRALMKAQNMHGAGGVRINRAGCLDRCQYGPVMVIYPEGVWYRYDNDDDVREIAQSHLINDKPVARLFLPDNGCQAAAVVEIDLSGLRCPLPVLRVKKALSEMRAGGCLRAFATDPGAAEDIPAFVRQAGHRLQDVAESGGGRFFTIVKC